MGWVKDNTHDGVFYNPDITKDFIPLRIDTVWSFNNYFEDEPPQSSNVQMDSYTEFIPKNNRVFISNENLDCSLNRDEPTLFNPTNKAIFILHRETNVCVQDISMKNAKFSDRLNDRIFAIEENHLKLHLTLPTEWHLGGFRDGHMKRIIIPRSCKKIGDFALFNTKISSVTISRDCEYSDTSFPPDCIINYYDEE